MLLHYSIGICLVELDQLRGGFSCLKFDELLKNHPEIIKKVFMPQEFEVTANYIQDTFMPNFSPLGTTNRHREEAIIMNWIQYLQHVEGTLTVLIEA